jgi:mitochondrial distribution and morphology protein 10
VIDGSISYLYSTLPLDRIPSSTPSIPLRILVRGYRDIRLPPLLPGSYELQAGDRKPTLLHATLALPPPSTLTALYARRINPCTLFSLSLNSKSLTLPSTNSSPPPASVLAHIQYDTGRYRAEALGSTDSALLGLRGLWNFGYPASDAVDGSSHAESSAEGLTNLPSSSESTAHRAAVKFKPSLLSAGAEVYYSPLSSVIGLSTGLRFTTLPPALPASSSSKSSKPLAGTSATFSSAAAEALSTGTSSFPYTMSLTMTPLTGSLASTYSIKPTPNLALSSRFGFNVYSWESEYVLGAEIWRSHRKPTQSTTPNADGLDWARHKAALWLDDAQKKLLWQSDKQEDKHDESVIKLRVDDNWNIKALWTGRIKELLVSAGVSLSPTSTSSYRYQMSRPGVNAGGAGFDKRWKGSVGVEVAYSS